MEKFKKFGSRMFVATLGAAVFAALALVVPAGPAAAAVPSEPVAIAVGRAGDSRVLQVGGDGKSNSSPIVMAPYTGNTDSASPRQRWNFERVTGSGIPTFAYRIKNPVTGKCLNASGSSAQNGAAVILYTCIGTASTKNEIWWMDANPRPGGVRFRSLRDSRCLDITGANTANNAATEVYTCVETDSTWNQMFKTRTASFDCTTRDSDWQVTAGLCVSPAPAIGVMGSWFSNPSTMAYRDPSTYVLSNELRSRIEAAVINNGGSETGNVQLGWRALRAPTSSGGVTYNAYWQEYGSNVEEYHEIPAADPVGDPNGSTVADGMQHTYLMTSSTTSGQWDLFYDFNYVATTVRQTGVRADFAEAGVQSRYIDALTQSQPFEFRVQLLDAAGFWYKPDVTATALGNDKECGTFPIWEDFSGGAGNNQPPWCLSTARTLTAGKTQVDKTVVSKPTSTVSLAPANPNLTAPAVRAGVVDGIDQDLLNRCIADDPSACLREVPGLQRCVQQHLVCHAPVTASRPRTTRETRPTTTLSSAQAIDAVRSQIHLVRPGNPGGSAGKPEVQRSTLAAVSARTGAIDGFPADTPVFLITGNEPVASWNSDSGASYGRCIAVVDANTGAVLYARLDHPM